jgi:NADH-quinone oxidoreductase subunit G
VGALTSKPFRYQARTWELSRRKSVSPHDSTGANLIVQVKNHKVLRVLPLENEAVNECWIADRDRFSYEALDVERLIEPMIKQGGEWHTVDWQTALEYVANGLKKIKAEFGANAIGLLASPHSTVEELALAGALVRGLGSESIDSRLRAADFHNAAPAGSARWLGMPIADLTSLQRVLVIGSNLRKDHPLFAQRIRQAVRHGAQLSVLTEETTDWAMPIANLCQADTSVWVTALASIAAAIAEANGVQPPVAAEVNASAQAVAKSLLSGEHKAILLGNAAAHHEKASSLLMLANWIAEQTGARVGYLTEAANTVGAQLVRALPGAGGLNAAAMLAGGVKATLLFNVEPGADSAVDGQALARAGLVVTLSPFKTNLDISDVLLPIAPFSETSGSFVNAEGRLQSFHAVVRPLGETRPGWKVLRVLGNLLGLPGFDADSSLAVLAQALPGVEAGQMVDAARLLNAASLGQPDMASAMVAPCVASIYQLDGLVRRASSLQLTADARQALPKANVKAEQVPA